uniref:Uncharacterized protein n=1 Tax=Echeneis naucrates TaxID=173247 RepID=A0A665UK59_ECHNA
GRPYVSRWFPVSKGPCHVTLDGLCSLPHTTGSYISEHGFFESAGCLYDNWKSGQIFAEKLSHCKHNL